MLPSTALAAVAATFGREQLTAAGEAVQHTAACSFVNSDEIVVVPGCIIRFGASQPAPSRLVFPAFTIKL